MTSHVAGMFNPKNPFAMRNMQIVLLRLDGTVFRIIGVEFGISLERVRQIYYRHTRSMRAPADSDHGKRYRNSWQDVMGIEPPEVPSA